MYYIDLYFPTVLSSLFSCHRMPSHSTKVTLLPSCRTPPPFFRRMVWEFGVWDSWINSEVLWEHPLWLCPHHWGWPSTSGLFSSFLFILCVTLASCILIPFISPCFFLNAHMLALLQLYLWYLSHCLVDSLTNFYLGSLRCRLFIPREPLLASDHMRNLMNVNEPTPWLPSDLLA